jgi:hypothetical protein
MQPSAPLISASTAAHYPTSLAFFLSRVDYKLCGSRSYCEVYAWRQWLSQAFNILFALLFPTSGLIRGLNAIVRGANTGAMKLDKACKAGALIMVTRDHGWTLHVGKAFDVLVVEQTRGQSGHF